jgi:hypothetical protein
MQKDSAKVTATLDGFTAVSEFWGHRDTCGEAAMLCLEHCKDGLALNGPDVDEIRADMIAKGYDANHGTLMSDLVDYFRTHRGLDVEYVNGYGSTWDGGIHQACLDHAGRDGVILEVELASKLTGNEGRVRRHYIAIGGIHPKLGYLVANGDDVMATNAHHGHGKVIPCRWMSKSVLASAKPSACAIVRGLSWHPQATPAHLVLPQAQLVDGWIVDSLDEQIPDLEISDGEPEAQDQPDEHNRAIVGLVHLIP